MGWAQSHIERLQLGETVQFRPQGHSMAPIVNHNSLVTVEPATARSVKRGDVVLCRVKGREYLHLVRNKDQSRGRVMIGNNQGGTNGWTKAVFGKCVRVEQ